MSDRLKVFEGKDRSANKILSNISDFSKSSYHENGDKYQKNSQGSEVKLDYADSPAFTLSENLSNSVSDLKSQS